MGLESIDERVAGSAEMTNGKAVPVAGAALGSAKPGAKHRNGSAIAATHKPGIAQKLKKHVRQMETSEKRAGADTLKLWEYYREQALLWRGLSLLYLPATLLSVFAALIMYFFADTRIVAEPNSLPGWVKAYDLPDTEFVDFAKRLVTLIATYQPDNAEKQFSEAREVLWEPALTAFETKVLNRELQMILTTKRTQIYFPDEQLLKLDRYPDGDTVEVRIPGVRLKLIGDAPQPTDDLVYYIKMSTIPRNSINKYGIVAIDVRAEKMPRTELIQQDRIERKKHLQNPKENLAQMRARGKL